MIFIPDIFFNYGRAKKRIYFWPETVSVRNVISFNLTKERSKA